MARNAEDVRVYSGLCPCKKTRPQDEGHARLHTRLCSTNSDSEMHLEQIDVSNLKVSYARQHGTVEIDGLDAW